MKKEIVFLAPESVVVPNFRDTVWLQKLPEAPAEKPWIDAAKDMFFAVLVGVSAVWAANGLAKHEFFAAIFAPFFNLFGS